jgi:hypothetical protein
MPGETEKPILPHPRSAQYARPRKSKFLSVSLKNDKVKQVAIGGMASEWISYILTEDEYMNGGGYESSVSFYGPKLGEIISGEAIKSALPLAK